jgi:hypothetical protein
MRVIANEDNLIFQHYESEHINKHLNAEHTEYTVYPLLDEVSFGEIPICD